MGGEIFKEGPLYDDFGWSLYLLDGQQRTVGIWKSVKPPRIIFVSKDSPFVVWEDNLLNPYGKVLFIAAINESKIRLIYQSLYSPSLYINQSIKIIKADANSLVFDLVLNGKTDKESIIHRDTVTTDSLEIKQTLYDKLSDPEYGID